MVPGANIMMLMPKPVSQMKFEGQHEDEELLMFFRRHPIVMRRGLLALLGLFLLGLIPITLFPLELHYLWFGALGFALGSVALFYSWIGWYYSVYFVTDQRLIQVTHKGLFKSSLVDVGLNKIQSVNFQIAGLQETMFRFGTIILQTYIGDLVMEKIHHPEKIHRSLVKIIKKYGNSDFLEDITGGEK